MHWLTLEYMQSYDRHLAAWDRRLVQCAVTIMQLLAISLRHAAILVLMELHPLKWLVKEMREEVAPASTCCHVDA